MSVKTWMVWKPWCSSKEIEAIKLFDSFEKFPVYSRNSDEIWRNVIFSCCSCCSEWQRGAIASSCIFIWVLQYSHIAVKLKNYSNPAEQKEVDSFYWPELGPTSNYVGQIFRSSC